MAEYPRVIVDLRHRALEVLLAPGPSVETRELDDAHLVDIEAHGRAVSFEVLTLHDLKIEEMAERFGFGDQVPTIRAEMTRVMTPSTAASTLAAPMIINGSVTLDPSGASSTEDGPDAMQPVEITLEPR